MRVICILFLLLIGTAFVCGCTAPASSPATQQNTAPAATQVAAGGPVKVVSLKASSYNPEQLYVKTGTTVTWVNEEDHLSRRIVHMPTGPTDKVLFQSGALYPGDSFSYTFTAPGRYIYADPQRGGGRSPFVEVTA